MDYSRVSLADAAGRVLVALQGDIAAEQDRILTALDAIRADPSKTRPEKHLAQLQHEAAWDALSWVFDKAADYFTPVGGDGS